MPPLRLLGYPFRRLVRLTASPIVMAATEARQAGLLAGHQDYTRFLILCRGRTGSNMLRSGLNEHGAIRAYGELFRRPGLIGWDLWPYPSPAHRQGQYRHILRRMERDPIGFLERYIYGRQPQAIQAVGFKMFYYYAHQPHWEPVWDHLLADPALRVIHLRRRNRLAVLLSQTHATRDGQWVDRKGVRRKRAPLHLDPQEARRFFEKNERWERKYAERFADHPMLELFYEDLAGDFDAEMRRVQAFLGVPYRPTRPRTYRQSHKPLSEAILNYDALREAFADTRWAGFFEDPAPAAA